MAAHLRKHRMNKNLPIKTLYVSDFSDSEFESSVSDESEEEKEEDKSKQDKSVKEADENEPKNACGAVRRDCGVREGCGRGRGRANCARATR